MCGSNLNYVKVNVSTLQCGALAYKFVDKSVQLQLYHIHQNSKPSKSYNAVLAIKNHCLWSCKYACMSMHMYACMYIYHLYTVAPYPNNGDFLLSVPHFIIQDPTC